MLKNVGNAARLISGEEANNQARRSQANATCVLERHPHLRNSESIQLEAYPRYEMGALLHRKGR
jgi:hypothetical protein